jgi:hypothetical protein
MVYEKVPELLFDRVPTPSEERELPMCREVGTCQIL